MNYDHKFESHHTVTLISVSILWQMTLGKNFWCHKEFSKSGSQKTYIFRTECIGDAYVYICITRAYNRINLFWGLTTIRAYQITAKQFSANFPLIFCFPLVDYWQTITHPLPRNTFCLPRDQVALILFPEDYTWQQLVDLLKTFQSPFQDQDRSAILLCSVASKEINSNWCLL